ncbi:mannose-1-phosphate guanylyltransferase [Halosolutus gelatinilyticus]|uniref:mannose-1-phosphate guanylyltransferase n=1 Tax=Halosolutus gelatinilyticus TaxID=2931975 RepID=UPI001FF51BDC|nr:sugar phosphate nucleotidyltransferase [Halosolutus gelatinilyticus]
MNRPLVACVLAGGTGTRLYPASRPDRPKQLLALGGDRSLLERTLDRVAIADERYVLTRASLADDVRAVAPEAGVLVEPAARDTGPALVYAAWRLRDRFETDPVLLSLPSDHHVADGTAFAAALKRAARIAAETDGLVTLGVEPTRPATGFGYVLPAADAADDAYAPIDRFTEKPDRETATDLVDAGAYWNAGIFAWTPSALLRAARDSPLAPLVAALEDGDPERGFDAVDAVSVDYAIMERTDDAYVTPLSAGWDDLGTWDAVGRVRRDDRTADPDGTVVLDGDVRSIDAAENVIAAPGREVSVLGVEGVVIAAYDDRILVADREQADRVREIVAARRERESR